MHATMLLLLLLLFSGQHLSTTAIDTLALGQSLPWNETLVSKGGNFELGLFSPGTSGKHYIGIWYKKTSKQTVVWVANRANPIVKPSTSRFMLSIHGELLLLTTPSNTLLWSSNASSRSPRRTTVATLRDDGNLLVQSSAALTSSSDVAWQSFDHPTDTWLPGDRLGYDRGAGNHSFLTSWTDSENPSPGAFSMEIDARGQPKFDLFAGGAHQYWTTGMWDGEIFVNVPDAVRLLRRNPLRAEERQRQLLHLPRPDSDGRRQLHAGCQRANAAAAVERAGGEVDPLLLGAPRHLRRLRLVPVRVQTTNPVQTAVAN